MSPEIEVDSTSIRRQVARTGIRGTMLQVKLGLGTGSDELTDAVATAVAAVAKDTMRVIVMATTPAPGGPVISVIGGFDPETLRAWADDVVQREELNGFSGRLRAATDRWGQDGR